MSNSRKVALTGSERVPLQGARAIGPTDPHQLVEISVILKHRQPLETAKHTDKFMSHSDFASQYGADPNHVDMIRKFATDNNLQVLERGDEVLRRTVTLAGTAANMEKAFGIELVDYDHPDGYYRGRIGAIQLPEEIAPFVRESSASMIDPLPSLTSAIAATLALLEPAPQTNRSLPRR